MIKYLLFASCFLTGVSTLAQTPIHYYPFNGNANDAIGTLNGTVVGATLTTDRLGNANSAYSFNGISDKISFSSPLTNSTNNFTITAWVKPNTTSDGTFLYNGQSGSNNGYGLQVLNSQYNGVINGDSSYLGSTPPTTGAWTMVALVKEDTIRLYINGVEQSIKILSITPNAPLAEAFIGSLTTASGFWDGAIDEVKVFGTALSAAEIQQELSPVFFPISATAGGPGAGTCVGTLKEYNNGGSATGLGCGGGSAGWYGGNGGNGLYGGGGAGAAGYVQDTKQGGDGGIGVVVLTFFDAGSNMLGAELLTDGTSITVPPGAATSKIWAIGAGGGGAGAGSGIPGSPQSSNDPTAGGGGGAGGVAYITYTVTPGSTINYTLGVPGTGGVGPNNGQSGTATTVTYSSTTITGMGGDGGIFNTGATAAGGSFSGGDGGAAGGSGLGAVGDVSGGSGGGIGGGTSTTGTPGCGTGGGYVGANSNDVGDLFSALSTSINLPLSLIAFTANVQNRDVLLQWKTADEVNIDHFELEKSEDMNDFKKIMSFKAGKSDYNSIDNNAFSKVQRVFYRLKSVEKNGTFSYSKTLIAVSKSQSSFSTYPNPVRETLTLTGLELYGKIELFSTMGTLILEQNISNQTTTINMQSFAPGTYILRCRYNNEIKNQKIIKE